MRILTLQEMELIAGGGGSRPKVKRAPKRTGSHSGGSSSGCGGGSHSGQGSSSGGGCGTPPTV